MSLVVPRIVFNPIFDLSMMEGKKASSSDSTRFMCRSEVLVSSCSERRPLWQIASVAHRAVQAMDFCSFKMLSSFLSKRCSSKILTWLPEYQFIFASSKLFKDATTHSFPLSIRWRPLYVSLSKLILMIINKWCLQIALEEGSDVAAASLSPRIQDAQSKRFRDSLQTSVQRCQTKQWAN